MRVLKGTVKNGVICPQESVDLIEGQSVIIVLEEQKKDEKTTQSLFKLSESLLLPELDENDPFFERDKDTGRELNF